MTIELITTKGFCHARIEGEMTIYTASEYRKAFIEQCHSRMGMELDLEKVTEMDISGVQLLLAIKKHLEGTELGLQLKNVSEAVQDVLKLTRLTGAFEAEPEEIVA